MASFSASRSLHRVLVANTVDDLRITGQHTTVELVHHSNSTSPVYFLVAKAAAVPSIAAANTEILLPGERLRIAGITYGGTGTFVSVISAGTPTVSVIGV